ncbi:ricin-type beta-trefoil lectin domain protein [Amycolatopsis sp. NPDC059021]|uniref:ricin-type beta-trefoil lectin domain protein n=1 Tax=Amycolatopsis sp. NPDC059021 TaxID=3346704 RepID=UPI0036727963
MKTSRRAAVLAATISLAVGALASPADAAPPGDAPVAASVAAQRPQEQVAADKSGHTLLYVQGPDETQLRAAVAGVGGTVSAAQPGRVRAAVPPGKVDELARKPGVREVKRPTRVLPASITSEGVAASGADAWIQAGTKGAGVKIGILDVGFGGLAEAQAAGELPSGAQLVTNGSNCLDSTVDDDHGVNVAEIVHDMAPDAQLYLSCVQDDMGFAPAADWLRQQGVQVISAAIAVPGAERGDGTSPRPDSPAQVVQRSREAGIMWAAAAGNYGELHFGGTAADRAGGNGWVEFSGSSEVNSFSLGKGARATVTLRWDAWPVTTNDLDLYVTDSAVAPTGPNDPHVVARSTLSQRDTAGGAAPVEETQFLNTTGAAATFYTWVKNNNAPYTTKFDLYVTKAATGALQWPTPAGSIAEPASSPYVLAAGATQPGLGLLETYSSRGPTIDGRAKPDLTGFDKVSTAASAGGTFGGTSAAAAHVAGAAALLKSANPRLDATGIESLLKTRARAVTGGSANDWGAGILALGSPGSAPGAVPGGYTPLTSPSRVLDTNTGIGGHQRRFSPGETFALAIPGAPADATAVVLTVTAGLTDGPTELRFTAENPGTAQPVRFPVAAGRQSALTMVVPLGADRAVRVTNTAGTPGVQVDFSGYFSPDGAGAYTARAGGTRLLDTHDLTGPRHTPLAGGEEIALQVRGVAGVPATATTVALNLTASSTTEPSTIAAYPQSYIAGTANAVYLNVGQRRSNLAVVRIGDDGKIRLRNSAGLTHLAADLLGWFAPGDGAKFVALPGSSRVIDTRTGNGVPRAAIGRGTVATAQVGGVGGVPRDATGVLVTGAVSDKILSTGVSLYAPETGWAVAPQVQADQGQEAAATAIAPLGAGGKLAATSSDGAVEMFAEVAGYFVGGNPAGPAGNCVSTGDEPGFRPLINGGAETSLARWDVNSAQRDGCEFGTLSGTAGPWNPADSFDNDYTLRLDWKATTPNSQSAVSVGGTRIPGVPNPQALVAISGGSAPALESSGAIKGVQAPATAAAKPVGEWNTFELTMAGPKLTVLLNGVKVNEYTNPAGFARHSMLSLSGHGTGDQVRFRNLRVRSNRVSGSGPVTGVGGACLNLAGGVPSGSTVEMRTCDGSPGQLWTADDLSLQVVGQCLEAQNNGTEPGTRVVAVACSGGPGQEWQSFSDGRIFNPYSAKCLSAAGSANGSALTIQGCNGQAQQLWTLRERSSAAGQLTNGFGNCLNVTNRQVGDDATVGTIGCVASLSDTWSLSPDGQIRALGRCLALKGGATTDGTRVVTARCTGDTAQQWQLRPEGGLVNAKSGKCLDSAQGATSVTIQWCVPSQFQTWSTVKMFPHKGRIVGIHGKCVDVRNNADANGTAVQLYPCNGSVAQQAIVQNDGTIRMKSRCVDVTGGVTANGTPVQLYDCTGVTAQRWFQRPDGMIENPMSGRCLGTRGAATEDSTQLVISDCAFQPDQRWGVQFD